MPVIKSKKSLNILSEILSFKSSDKSDQVKSMRNEMEVDRKKIEKKEYK